MTTIPYNPTEVTALRKEMALYGRPITTQAAWQVLRLVGDRSLCVDALLMDPRPEWLEKIAGPLKPKAKK